MSSRAGVAPPLLRAERDGDVPFLSALFAAIHGPPLALSGAPPATVDHLVAMQYGAQAASHRARFPDARRLILLDGGQPVGRLVVEREARDLYVVDVAVHPAAQGRGLGGTALAELQREAAAAGLGVRALVLHHNAPSLAMFGSRGFAPTGRIEGPSVELRWVS